MKAVRIKGATINLKGPPGSGIRDLPVARHGPYLVSEWTFSAEERAQIALGKNICVGLLNGAHPPMAVFLMPDICAQCGAEIKGAEQPESRRDEAGNQFHAACWEQRSKDLLAELEEFFADNDNFTETAPGVFKSTPEYERRCAHDKADAQLALDRIGTKLFLTERPNPLAGPDDIQRELDPVLIFEAIEHLCRLSPRDVAHAVRLARAAKQHRIDNPPP